MTLTDALRRAVPALILGLILTLTTHAASFAADWPKRPVRLLVSLGPGSGVDISARLFAEKLQQKWGQPVVVENRPGGDGIAAIVGLLGAKDDHTLLVAPVASFTAHPYFHDQVPYDAREMIPVARISRTVVAYTVPAALGVNTLKEMEALIRSRPDQLNWTTATGFTDFVFAGYLHTLGLKMTKVPYRNPAGAATDLASNVIQVYMPAYAIVRPTIESGAAKVLAVTNRNRAPGLPNVPTVTEEGYPSLEFDGLVGVFGTAAIPADVRKQVSDDIGEIARDPAIVQRITSTAQIVSPGNGEELAKSIAEQRAQVAAVAKIFGNKPVQ